MKGIRELNIWKAEPVAKGSNEAFLDAEIVELNLSVRSYNCLKRSGCNYVRDIYNCMGEDGQGLRKIRNLGVNSEKEILAKLNELETMFARAVPAVTVSDKNRVIRPSRSSWNKNIKEYPLSSRSLNNLSACGIRQVRDLYDLTSESEPGWFAVRELFEKIAH